MSCKTLNLYRRVLYKVDQQQYLLTYKDRNNICEICNISSCAVIKNVPLSDLELLPRTPQRMLDVRCRPFPERKTDFVSELQQERQRFLADYKHTKQKSPRKGSDDFTDDSVSDFPSKAKSQKRSTGKKKKLDLAVDNIEAKLKALGL